MTSNRLAADTTNPVADYEEWYTEKLAASRSYGLAAWHHQVIRVLPDLTGLRVADIGTGMGALPRWLSECTAAADIVASDYSERAVAAARNDVRGRRNVSIEWQDAQDIRHADESFDVTICCHAIEHVVDPDKALAELVRVTKRGGLLILAFPNYMSLTGLYRLGWKLKGKSYRESGQPINHPLLLPVIASKLKRLGCIITGVDGEYHMLYWPFAERRHVLIRSIERPPFRRLSRWFGFHAVIRSVRR